MNCTTVHNIFFSPTHTSGKIARSVAKGTEVKNIEDINLTYDSNNSPIIIKNGIVIISVPVYAGRVAPKAAERIKRLRGENTPVILVVVYGNRDYEDALVELRDIITERGFIPLSAGAFIGEHSYSRENMPIAAGRPDDEDLELARLLGRRSLEKLERLSSPVSLPAFYIKGNIPYRDVASSAPASPDTLADICNLCSECIGLCPTEAMFINDKGKIDTNKALCIKCCACVKECPSRARVFDTPYTAMLHQKCALPKAPELFF